MEVDRYVQSTQNRKLVIFLRYIKKKVSQLLLFSIEMQNIQIFNMGPVMLVVTCFSVAVIKNGRSILGHETLKSAIYISGNDRMTCFLHTDTHLRKLIANFITIG